MPTVFPTWASYFAWMGDKHGLKIQEAARVTVYQIMAVYLHTRNKDGELQFDAARTENQQTEFEAYREMCFLNGILDEGQVKKLYGLYLAKADALAARFREPQPDQPRGESAGEPPRPPGLRAGSQV